MSESSDPNIMEAVQGHERLTDIPVVKDRKMLGLAAAAGMQLLFDGFDQESLIRRGEPAHSLWDDNPYYTETTPFLEDGHGNRVAIQKYFYERKEYHRRDSFLGRLGLSREVETVQTGRHYAIVMDAGEGELREYARVNSGGGFIHYDSESPRQIALQEGSLEEDTQVVKLLDTMARLQALGSAEPDTPTIV